MKSADILMPQLNILQLLHSSQTMFRKGKRVRTEAKRSDDKAATSAMAVLHPWPMEGLVAWAASPTRTDKPFGS